MDHQIAHVMAGSRPSPLDTEAAWDAIDQIYWTGRKAEDMLALLHTWGWGSADIEAFAATMFDRVDADDPHAYRFTRGFNYLSALKRLFEVGSFGDQSPATLRVLGVLEEPVGRASQWMYGLADTIVASTAVTEPTLVRLVRATANMHVVRQAMCHPNTTKAVAREALLIDHSKATIARSILEWEASWDDAWLLRDALWFHREYERPSDKFYARRVRARLDGCAPHELPALLVAYAAFDVERAVNYLRRMAKRRVREVPAGAWADLLSASPGRVSLSRLRAEAILTMSHAADAPRAERRSSKMDKPTSEAKPPALG